MSLEPLANKGRGRRGRQAFSDLQDTSQAWASDLRSTRNGRETKFGGIVRASRWADSCFPGLRPPGASTNNKTILYDLYLWALGHLIAAAREGARGIALTESFRARRPRRADRRPGPRFQSIHETSANSSRELAWDVAVNLFLVSREARRQRGVAPQTFKLKRYSAPGAISTYLFFFALETSLTLWKNWSCVH